MADSGMDGSQLLRDGVLLTGMPGATITGIAYHTGDLVISAREKAKTVVGDPAAVEEGQRSMAQARLDLEVAKVIDGLGVKSNSVANIGENARTAAAMAVVKLALAYNLRLNDIENIYYNTETPRGISENDATQVIRMVNDMSAVLKKHGIDIGMLQNIEEASHSQSACVSGVCNVTRIARNQSVSGKTLVITADTANYVLGHAADETGGHGATVLLVENGGKGIRLTRHTGGTGGDSPDFTKPIEAKSEDEVSGMSMVSKYPIVFGKYSEYVKILRTFTAMKKALQKASMQMSDPEALDRVVVVPHIPFPKMAEKELANVVIHFMRTNDEINARVLREVEEVLKGEGRTARNLRAILGPNPSVPRLDGFETQTETFKFIDDVAGMVLHMQQKKEAGARAESAGQKQPRINNVRAGAESLLDQLEKVRDRYHITEGSELDKLIGNVEARIREVVKNGGSRDDLIAAFKDLYEPVEKKSKAYINQYMERESAFNSAVRETQAYKEMKARSSLDSVLELPSVSGNIYTGSAILALVSYVARADPEIVKSRDILLVGYGSGAESYAVLMKPQEIEQMRSTLRSMMEFDKDHKVEITSEQYKRARMSEDLEDFVGRRPPVVDVPIVGLHKINPTQLLEYAQSFRAKFVPDTSMSAHARSEPAPTLLVSRSR